MSDNNNNFVPATFGLDETLATADPTETLRLPVEAWATLESLPPIALNSGFLNIGPTLGEGGMGLVRGAVQQPFGRTVALKTVRAELAKRTDLAQGLLREAIATGRLEHPNIVPIYAVGRDENGQPVIVMKRIEGSSWRDIAVGLQDEDPLTRNLEIFQQVCSAVHFAHSHGILHRDIKLDNVMVGAHDDVYLVDWGLAVTVRPETDGLLPAASEATGICGTPTHMAPEMTAGGRQPIDVRTDIYLLGATLHEAVTGTPRHWGTTIIEILQKAHVSASVDYSEAVQPQLAAICNKATARNPEDRYTSALELRAAIRQFLAHRHASTIAEEAEKQLAALRDTLASNAPVDQRRIAIYRHYGAARFGFERSLSEWPEQQPARTGLQTTLETMIGWELSQGGTHAAAAMLADLPFQNPTLSASVHTAEQSLHRERQEVAALREQHHQLDVRVGARKRAFQAGMLLVGGMFLPILLNISMGFPPWFKDPFYFWMVAVGTCLPMIAIIAFASTRSSGLVSLPPTRTNRRIAVAIVIVCAFLIVFRGAMMWSHVPIPVTLSLEMIAFAMFTAVLATFVDAKLFGSTAIYLVFAGLPLVYPHYDTFLYVAATSAALAWVILIWKTPENQTT